MKRSEALKKLERTFRVYFNNQGLPEHTFPEISSIVLDQIEGLGMLPPTICYSSVDEYVNIDDTDILEDNDVYFAWEP